ncbi:3-isopropylmalate dehydrogenase [Rhodospirillum centenum]|uniref:3-isopropylmalate dehydrogenase n=1 Tax=Rhodospirillum centenum (strain ATCC 51521 / SW) TaxID=414684 RepID=B6IYD0_RHOCS|nr:3-isopropylmalate dehydrogenase [Rhodospirillum centenum]ACJ01304.1 3-isopropylmalate dehydrogenase [Rhodospirillum centenum SW]
MAGTRSLLLLPGDGIGPEVMRQVRRYIDWMARKRGIEFTVEEGLVGGAAIDAQGVPLTDATLEKAKAADAVLFGAVGGPKWDGLGFDMRPEAGLLRLRKELDLFANLRPAKVFDALVDASSLKPDIVRGLDVMIVRELTGGIYFGEPRGIEDLGNGQRRGVNTQVYTTAEIHRVARIAFELARKRGNKVCSVEKGNVMESGLLWRQEVTALHRAEYGDVELSHMLADACSMQLVRNPGQFDVIVTDNLFGDMLSDEAAMLTGSIGMLPSASLGAPDADGRRRALYEPVHGSAPDIAGRDMANPIAMLLSLGMALRWSFDLHAEADMLEQAVQNVLRTGMRTSDIMQPGMARCSTSVMADTILRELDKLAA